MSKKLLLKKLLARAKKKTSVLDKILFSILALGFAMMIAFFAYLIWFTLSNRSVTHFLPSENTVAYFELEDLTLPPKFDQEKLFDLVGVSAILTKTFGLDVGDIQDYLTQGRLGFALIKDDEDKTKLSLFLRTQDKSATLDYFESLGVEGETLATIGEKKNIIYSYPQSHAFVFSFIGPYLFISQDLDTLKQIQSVRQKEAPSLNENTKYLKSLANLPRQTWGRGYLNIQTLNLGAGSPMSPMITPLKSFLNHFALTIRKQPNGFHFNSLMSINSKLLALKKGYTDPTRFTYSLADYIGSKNSAIYIGGANLADEWENTLDTISNLNPAYGIILEGILRAQIAKLFGDDVSLRDDIYPLFEGEYALVFENLPPLTEGLETETSRFGLKLILKHDDMNFVKVKLEKLLDGFGALAAQYAPKLKVFLLPDGTESRELVADPTRLTELTEDYEDYEIKCMDVTGSVFGFCYTVTDQLVVLSNHVDSIKETIDLSTSPKFVLSQSQGFRKALSNLSAISDEITYVAMDSTSELFKNSKIGLWINNLFGPFEAATWIKHYFNDGVSTEGFLLLK